MDPDHVSDSCTYWSALSVDGVYSDNFDCVHVFKYGATEVDNAVFRNSLACCTPTCSRQRLRSLEMIFAVGLSRPWY